MARERFAWYCLLYGGAACLSGATWAILLQVLLSNSVLMFAYLLAAILPFGAALIGWRLLRGQQPAENTLMLYLQTALYVSILAEVLYFGGRATQSRSMGVHLLRNILLDLWLPYLFVLWLRQPLLNDLNLSWRRGLGSYLIVWGIIALLFGLIQPPPAYMPQVAWVLVTIALYSLVITIGSRLWLQREITRWLMIAILTGLGFLVFVDLIWIRWLIDAARTGRFTHRVSDLDGLVLYLVGGINDVLYSLAPLILLGFLYWEALTAAVQQYLSAPGTPYGDSASPDADGGSS